MYHKVPLSLSESQFHKLRKGHPIQLAHHQIGSHGKHWLALHPETVKKVHAAHRKGKGCRIHVSPHEMEASGEGLMDFWNKIKSAANWVSDKVINTDFYQNNVRPLAKQGVNALIDNFVPSVARDSAHKAADFVSDKTGAFGLMPKKKAGRPRKQVGRALTEREHAMVRQYANEPVWQSGNHVPKNINKGYHLSQDMSRLISPVHPAMWPVAPSLPPIGGGMKKNKKHNGLGGSFLPA